MKPKSELSLKLYNEMLRRGYPEPFCDEVTRNLNTDFTAKRMLGYMRYYNNISMEEIADEMLAIISDRNRIMAKKDMIATNASWNQMRMNGLFEDDIDDEVNMDEKNNRYVVDKAYLDKVGGTCFYEFLKGKYDHSNAKACVWREDSAYISCDAFEEIHLNRLFSKILDDYDKYGVNEVSRSQWESVYELALENGGEWNAAISELSAWAEENFRDYDEFTIIGM